MYTNIPFISVDVKIKDLKRIKPFFLFIRLLFYCQLSNIVLIHYKTDGLTLLNIHDELFTVRDLQVFISTMKWHL